MIVIKTSILPSTEWEGSLGLFSEEDVKIGTIIWAMTLAETLPWVHTNTETYIKYRKSGYYNIICKKYVLMKDEGIFMRSSKDLMNVNIFPDEYGNLKAMQWIDKGEELLPNFKDYMNLESLEKFKKLDPKKEEMSRL